MKNFFLDGKVHVRAFTQHYTQKIQLYRIAGMFSRGG